VTEIPQEEAYSFLVDAANDYNLQYSQKYYELNLLKTIDPELCEALTQWESRPQLPPPERPPYPAVRR